MAELNNINIITNIMASIIAQTSDQQHGQIEMINLNDITGESWNAIMNEIIHMSALKENDIDTGSEYSNDSDDITVIYDDEYFDEYYLDYTDNF